MTDERYAALERENEALRRELAQLRKAAAPDEAPTLTRLLADRSLLEQLPDVVMVLDRDHRILYLNRAAPGRKVSELIGQYLFDLVQPEERAPRRAALEKVWETGEPDVSEICSVNGFWWETRNVPIREDGETVLILTTALDCTDRKRAELSLRDSERHLRHAIEATGMGTWVSGANTSEVHWDDTVCKIYGLEPTGGPRHYLDFLQQVHPDDIPQLRASVIAARAKGYGDLRYRIIRPDGAVRHILAKGTWVYDGERLVSTLGGVFDVTHQRLLEEQVGQVQKMEAIGQLTAGIAHNFNNILGIILPNAELLQRAVDPALAPRIDAIHHAGKRGAEMVRQLMLFARRDGNIERGPIDIALSLQRTADICRTTFDRVIAIELVIAPGLPSAVANAGQIEQVLLNICLNARDALVDIDSPRVKLEALPGPKGSVRVRVEDNGHGMDEATRARIFNPFFTTKEVQRGTGLGLATAFAIIADHQGTIQCQSCVGEGSSFEIELPGTEVCAPPEEERLNDDFQTGTGRVLLIDDEPLVRGAVGGILELAGYEVIEARDGAHGLDILHSEERPAAVILDRSMPGLSGEEVLARIIAHDPELPVILLSGDPGAARRTAGAAAILAKPTPAAILLRTLHEVLQKLHTE